MTTQTVIMYLLAASLFALAGYQMKTIIVLKDLRTFLTNQINMISKLLAEKA